MKNLQKILNVADRIDLANGESIDGWTGSTDVTAIATSSNHKSGSSSLSFAKSGTTATTGEISTTLNSKDCGLFFDGKLSFRFYVSAITDIESVSIKIGGSSSNYNLYTIPDEMISAGWNEFVFSADAPTSVTGDGVDWDNLSYLSFLVTFDATGSTLTGILLDSVSLHGDNAPIGDVQNPAVSFFGSVAVNVSAGDNSVIITGAAGHEIWVYGGTLMTSVAGTIKFEDSDGNALSGVMPPGANGGFSWPLSGNFAQFYLRVPAGKSLRVDVATADVDGVLSYGLIAV